MLEDQTLLDGWAAIENDLRAEWEASFLPRKRDRIWNQLRHLKALRQKMDVFAGDAPKN